MLISNGGFDVQLELAMEEIARLRAALKPLASWELYPNESDGIAVAVRGTHSRITVADIRAAKAALGHS